MISVTELTTRQHRVGRLDAEYFASPLQVSVAAMEKSAGQWMVLPKLATSIKSGGTPLGHDLEHGEIPFVTIDCIEPLWLDISRTKRVSAEHRELLLRRVWLKSGDVVITIKRRIANAGVVYEDAAGAVVNQDVAVLKPNGLIPAEVIAASLVSHVGQDQARLLQTEQINPYLSVTSLRKLQLPRLPDPVQEVVVELVRQRVAFLREAEQHVYRAMSEVSRFARVVPSGQRSSALATTSALRMLRRLDAEFYCRAQLTFEPGVVSRPLGSPAVASDLSNGVKPSAFEYSTKGLPIFKVGGLSRFASADWLGDRIAPSSLAAQGRKDFVRSGDVLVLAAAHATRYIGKAGLVQDIPDGEDARVVAELIRIRPAGINGPTLTAYFAIPAVKAAVQRLVRGQSAHLYTTDLQHLPVPGFPQALQSHVAELFKKSHEARGRSAIAWGEATQAVNAAVRVLQQS